MYGSSSFIIFWNCARSGDCAPHRQLSSGLDSESQTDGFGDRDEIGQPRIAASRQRPIEALTLDASSLGDFGDSPRARKMPQSNQKNPGFILIFQCGFEILGGKGRVFPEPPNDGLVMGRTGFALHEVRVLPIVV